MRNNEEVKVKKKDDDEVGGRKGKEERMDRLENTKNVERSNSKK